MQEYWVIKKQDKYLIDTMAVRRQICIGKFLPNFGFVSWETALKEGYRCVQVTFKEVKGR